MKRAALRPEWNNLLTINPVLYNSPITTIAVPSLVSTSSRQSPSQRIDVPETQRVRSGAATGVTTKSHLPDRAIP